MYLERPSIKPKGDSQYSRCDWLDPDGNTLAAISAHVWTNVKSVGGRFYRYMHNHFSIYFRTLVNGEYQLKGGIDFVHSQEKNQMQIEDIDVIMKTEGSRFIMRDQVSGHFWQLAIVDGDFKILPFDRDDVSWASAISKEVDVDGNDL
mgnify:CR=1 FL=1